MIKRIENKRHGCDEENPYWISFSDIMSGLLIIFVLAVLALILELTQTKTKVSEAIKELAKAEQVRRDILEEIVSELHKKNIDIKIVDNHTVLRIPDDLLSFESGKYRVPPHAENMLIEIGKTLYESINTLKRWQYLDTIFIEGHTDKRYSGHKYKYGNWELSTLRAISIWDFWNRKLPVEKKLNDFKNHIGKPLFSVSGYGATRPVTKTQLIEEDFKKNRRIDIRFTVKRPDLAEFQNIKKMLSDENTQSATN